MSVLLRRVGPAVLLWDGRLADPEGPPVSVTPEEAEMLIGREPGEWIVEQSKAGKRQEG